VGRPRPPAEITIREIHSPSDPAFGAAYRLLQRSFPVAELLPMRAWRDVMRERADGVWTDLAWHLLVATRGRGVLGVASGTYLGNVNVGIIGYIAVAEHARSAGLGGRLRRALRLKFEGDARDLRARSLEALMGEVQLDSPWLRRLARGGDAIPLDFPYYQPPLRRRGAEVPLVLYYQPLRGPRASLPTDHVRRLLYTVWRRAYRVPKPLSHPTFQRMMRALAGRRRIGRLRLGDKRPRTARSAP
jgi:hypothetical protein